MKSSILKLTLALSILATICLSGCASDPVVTSQTTTSSRRIVSPSPMETTTVTSPSIRQSTTTTY